MGRGVPSAGAARDGAAVLASLRAAAGSQARAKGPRGRADGRKPRAPLPHPQSLARTALETTQAAPSEHWTAGEW